MIPLWACLLAAVFAFVAGFLACLQGIGNGQKRRHKFPTSDEGRL